MGRRMGKPPSPVLLRLLTAFGAESLAALARAMNVQESTVKNWHARDSVPMEAVQTASKLTGRPMNWFLDEPYPKKFGSSALQVNESLAALSSAGAIEALREAGATVTRLCRETGYEPGSLWITLLQELVLEGLSERGVRRTLETLKAERGAR